MNRFVVLPVVGLLALAVITFGQPGPGARPGGASTDTLRSSWDTEKSPAEKRKAALDAFARLLKGELPLEQVWISAWDTGGKNPVDIYGSGVGFVDNVQIKLTAEQIRNLLDIFDKGKFFELDYFVGVTPKSAAPPPKDPPSPPRLSVMIGQDGLNVQLRRGGQSMEFSTLTRKLREAVAPLQASGLDLSKLTFQDALEKVAKGEVAAEALEFGAGTTEWNFTLNQSLIRAYASDTRLATRRAEVKLKAQAIRELAAKAGKANSALRDRHRANVNDPILAYDPNGKIDSIRIGIRGIRGGLYIAHSWEASDQKAGGNAPAAQAAYVELTTAIKQTFDDVMKEANASPPPGPGGNQARPGNPGRPANSLGPGAPTPPPDYPAPPPGYMNPVAPRPGPIHSTGAATLIPASQGTQHGQPV